VTVTTSDQTPDTRGPRPEVFRALRDNGDDFEAAAPPFEARSAAARLRAAAEEQGLIDSADTLEARLTATGRELEDAAPPFGLEADASGLRAAGAARGLLNARGPDARMQPRPEKSLYRLLGELEIGRGNQRIELPGGPVKAVLAALLINANQRLSKTDLITAAWGGRRIGEAQLSKRVANVRALLAQIGRERDLITHAWFGYEIRVADDDVDVLRFQRLVRQAEEARSAQRTTDEIAALREALALWRGPWPLASVSGDAIRHKVDQLERRRRRAAARLFDLELARHDYDSIRGELDAIARDYPADGHLAAQLMIAAFRCGDTAAATTAYEQHAHAVTLRVRDNLDRLLQDLNRAIVNGDETIVAAVQDIMTSRSREDEEEAESPQAGAALNAAGKKTTIAGHEAGGQEWRRSGK
jgi:DNA-binding SARP family transcriptional activator